MGREDTPGGRRIGQRKNEVADDERNEGCAACGRLGGPGDRQKRPVETKDDGEDPGALQDSQDELPAPEQQFPRAPGWALHGLPVARLGLEHERAGRIDHQFQENDVHRKKQRRQSAQQGQKRKAGDRDMDRGYVGDRAPEVREDTPPETNSAYD